MFLDCPNAHIQHSEGKVTDGLHACPKLYGYLSYVRGRTGMCAVTVTYLLVCIGGNYLVRTAWFS